jgi:hypothetical protein
MELEEFLELKGTDLSGVIAKARASLGRNEIIFAVGSLVEGLGNAKSDVDLLWVTPLDENSIPPAAETTWILGECVVDVQAAPLSALNELLDRLDAWSRRPWNVTHAANFSYDERRLLHRLLHGRPLRAPKKVDLSRLRPAAPALARLKLHVARQLSRTIQVDMVGYRDAGDFHSLVYSAQELLGQAVDALVAGYGFTNPIPKWRSRLLDQLPSDWERSLAVRPTGLKAGEVIWRLHRAPERADERLALKHAFRIATFARAVFARAELRFANHAAEEQELFDWPSAGRPSDRRPLPYLDLDVDFLLAEGRVALARLNEFSEAVEMSPREFILALLFDGETTARQAEIAVFGSGSDGEGARVVKRLASRLERAGLSVPGSRIAAAAGGRLKR